MLWLTVYYGQVGHINSSRWSRRSRRKCKIWWVQFSPCRESNEEDFLTWGGVALLSSLICASSSLLAAATNLPSNSVRLYGGSKSESVLSASSKIILAGSKEQSRNIDKRIQTTFQDCRLRYTGVRWEISRRVPKAALDAMDVSSPSIILSPTRSFPTSLSPLVLLKLTDFSLFISDTLAGVFSVISKSISDNDFNIS